MAHLLTDSSRPLGWRLAYLGILGSAVILGVVVLLKASIGLALIYMALTPVFFLVSVHVRSGSGTMSAKSHQRFQQSMAASEINQRFYRELPAPASSPLAQQQAATPAEQEWSRLS